jgi:hypothetical protein
MAYINGNKPIVTDGLIYALDFGNSRCYTSGSTQATSLAYDRATTSISGSPAFNNDLLDFTSTKFIKRDGSLPALDPNGTFTVMFVGNSISSTGTFFHQDTLNSTINPSSSLFGFGLDSGDFSRSYPGFTSSSLQHVTYRYSEGTIDTFINGIPVTASVANASLTNTAVSNALFLGDTAGGFSGSLAQFYVYNRALSTDEIYTTYLVSAERNGLPTVPKPYTQDENVYKYVQTTGITDLDTISAIDTFVSNLKSNGLWNKMTAIYPFLTTSTGSQAINLKDPGVLGLGLTGSFTGSNVGLTPASNTSFIETLGVTTDTLYPTVNTASSHVTLLSYDVPKTSSYPAAIVGGVGASGGVVTFANGRVIHTFTSGSGSFIPLHASLTAVEVLVVAGGGGGGRGPGNNFGGGGGGAGGLIYSSSFSVTPLTTYTTVVGQGGASGSGGSTSGSNGQNSQFGSIISTGGGGGGAAGVAGPASNGNTGGSGGGAGNGPNPMGLGGSGSAEQGFAGGNITLNAVGGRGAGGGGAGGTGSIGDYNGDPGGLGGPGLVYSISGLPVSYSAGGQGGFFATDNTGATGLANRGYGGGGTRFGTAGKGGSGVVIVSYPAITGQGPNSGFFITEDSISGSANSDFTSGITGSGTIGLLTVSRTGSNSFLLRKNNSQTTLNTPASGTFNLDLYLGGANLAGGTSSFGNSNTSISYASIGAGLTDSEVSTYYNLVSQFQTNLKRQNTLLDNYSGAAAAYSLRRIGPSGYFGPAIRVRRDSDNTLRDIGFTSDGQLDTVGLLDFVGVTGSGFVQTWYDQSGNSNNASQATTTRQPLVINSGSVVVNNSKAALNFLSSRYLQTPNDNSIKGNIKTFFTVANTPSQNNVDGALFGKGNDDGAEDYIGVVRKNYLYFDIGDGGGPYADAVVSLTSDASYLTTFYDSGLFPATLSMYLNSIDQNLSQRNNTRTRSNTTHPLTIGGSRNGSFLLNTKAQEYLFYFNDQTTNRTAIESNINTNYKIYGDATASFDPDYQSFITATGITQPTQSAALETLVSDLKSYGLWSKMKAIYPMVTDRNNRFAQSEDFSSTWNTGSASVSTNQTTAPNGTTTADLILDVPPTETTYIVNGDGSNYYFTSSIDGPIGGGDPTLTLEKGKTYIFNITDPGSHPFYILTGSGYTAGGVYNDGVSGYGTSQITFVVPESAPNPLYYGCSTHLGMAGQLTINENSSQHYIYQTIDGATGIVTGSEYVLSTYAKFYNTPYIAFKTNVGAQAWFDVQTGATGSYTGSNATITDEGNGWYRCALYFTSSETTGPYNQQIHLARTDNDLTFAGTGTSGSYLWGAQFENGNLLGPYRKTEGSGFAVSGSDSMLDQMKYNLKDPGY